MPFFTSVLLLNMWLWQEYDPTVKGIWSFISCKNTCLLKLSNETIWLHVDLIILRSSDTTVVQFLGKVSFFPVRNMNTFGKWKTKLKYTLEIKRPNDFESNVTTKFTITFYLFFDIEHKIKMWNVKLVSIVPPFEFSFYLYLL